MRVVHTNQSNTSSLPNAIQRLLAQHAQRTQDDTLIIESLCARESQPIFVGQFWIQKFNTVGSGK